MALKDILVHIDNGPNSSNRPDAALGLTAEHGAHLAGLYVVTRSRFPGYIRAQIPDDLMQQRARAIEQAAADAERIFNEHLQRAGVNGSGGARRACRRRSPVCTGAMPISSSSGREILRGKKVPMVGRCPTT